MILGFGTTLKFITMTLNTSVQTTTILSCTRSRRRFGSGVLTVIGGCVVSGVGQQVQHGTITDKCQDHQLMQCSIWIKPHTPISITGITIFTLTEELAGQTQVYLSAISMNSNPNTEVMSMDCTWWRKQTSWLKAEGQVLRMQAGFLHKCGLQLPSEQRQEVHPHNLARKRMEHVLSWRIMDWLHVGMVLDRGSIDAAVRQN